MEVTDHCTEDNIVNNRKQVQQVHNLLYISFTNVHKVLSENVFILFLKQNT